MTWSDDHFYLYHAIILLSSALSIEQRVVWPIKLWKLINFQPHYYLNILAFSWFILMMHLNTLVREKYVLTWNDHWIIINCALIILEANLDLELLLGNLRSEYHVFTQQNLLFILSHKSNSSLYTVLVVCVCAWLYFHIL